MNKRSNFDKSWIKYENFLKFSFHRAQKNLHFVKLGLRKSRWKMPTPPKKGKIPEFWAFSHIFFSSFHDCNDHKRLPQTIGARFYQMDHIWWAPHMHKKLSGPKMEPQLRNTFGQSLISTLFWYFVETLYICPNLCYSHANNQCKVQVVLACWPINKQLTVGSSSVHISSFNQSQTFFSVWTQKPLPAPKV